MTYPASTVRLALQYAREEWLRNPGQSLAAAVWFATARVEHDPVNRSRLYEEVEARLRRTDTLTQIDTALAELWL